MCLASRTILACVFLIFLASLQAADTQDASLFSYVINLSEAKSPHIFSDYLIFSHSAPPTTRSIAIAFAHENYRHLHLYHRLPDRPHLFYYAEDIKRLPPISRLEYRIVIDSVWIDDQTNPMRKKNENGLWISYLDLPYTVEQIPEGKTRFDLSLDNRENPFFRSAFQESFSAHQLVGHRISLVGDFNHWDPHRHLLQELPHKHRNFFIDLRLPPGEYSYYFLVDGKKILDPKSNAIKNKGRGHLVSVKKIRG